MNLTKKTVSISDYCFMLPKLTLRIKLVGYLSNNFGAVVIRNTCVASRFAFSQA